MTETFSPAAVDDERMSMDSAMQSAPIDAQVRRALRYAPYFEGKRVVEAYIEELERERAEAAEHRLSPRTMSEYLDATQQLVAALITNLGKRDAERRRFKLGNPGRSLAAPTDEEVDAYLARCSLVQPREDTESAWLIEANGAYWTGSHADERGFSPKHDEALRFARFQDAEKVKYWLLKESAFALRSTEHVWLKPRSSGTPDEQPTTVDALALYDKESWDMDQRLGD